MAYVSKYSGNKAAPYHFDGNTIVVNDLFSRGKAYIFEGTTFKLSYKVEGDDDYYTREPLFRKELGNIDLNSYTISGPYTGEDVFDGTYWCYYNEGLSFNNGILSTTYGETLKYSMYNVNTAVVETEYGSEKYYVISEDGLIPYESEYDYTEGYYYYIYDSCNEKEYKWEHCQFTFEDTYWYNSSEKAGVFFKDRKLFKNSKSTDFYAGNHNENIIVIADSDYKECAYYMVAEDKLYYSDNLEKFNDISSLTSYDKMDRDSYFAYFPDKFNNTYWARKSSYGNDIYEVLFFNANMMYSSDGYESESSSYILNDDNSFMVSEYHEIYTGDGEGFMGKLNIIYTLKEDGTLLKCSESYLDEVLSTDNYDDIYDDFFAIYEPCKFEDVIRFLYAPWDEQPLKVEGKYFVEKFSYWYGDQGVYFKDGKCYMNASSEGYPYEILLDCYVAVKIDDITTIYFAGDYSISRYDDMKSLLSDRETMSYSEVENEKEYKQYVGN